MMRGTTFSKMTSPELATWSCISCRGLHNKSATVAKPTSTPKTLDDVYNALMDIKKEIIAEQKAILAQIRDVSESQQFISEQYDQMITQLKEVKSMGALTESSWESTQNRLISAEQYSRRHHLEIGNIPVAAGEDVEGIVCSAARRVGVQLGKEEIAAAHRLRAKEGKTPSIIVEFVSRKKRNELYGKRKESLAMKPKIYFNESLSPYFKNLWSASKAFATEFDCKYVWYTNYRILIRKAEKYKPVVVRTLDDLKNLKQNSNALQELKFSENGQAVQK